MGHVDYEALYRDLRREVRSARGRDGGPRTSWGRGELLGLFDDLEGRHEIDESADRAVLRRFEGALTDTFLGLLPPPESAATTDPLTAADPSGTAGVMARDAAIRSTPIREDECSPHHPPPSSSSPRPRTAAAMRRPVRAAT